VASVTLTDACDGSAPVGLGADKVSNPSLAIPGIHALIKQRAEQRAMCPLARSRPAKASGVSPGGCPFNRQGKLSPGHRESLLLEYGEEAVSAVEAASRTIFEQVETEHPGCLSLSEFALILGQLGATSAAEGRRGLATYLFGAVDIDDDGSITFDEFVQWKLTMLCGSPESKLRLGFNICDLNGDGSINKSEVGVLLTSVFSVLSGLNLGKHNPGIENMLDALFKHSLDGESLSWEQYCQACMQDKSLISHLGHERLASVVHSESAAATSSESSTQQKQMGSLSFFGEKRWEMMLSLMVGLQLAIEHTSAIDATDAADLAHQWASNGQDTLDDENHSTEPIPQRVYTIPSAWDRHEAENDQYCRHLVVAVSNLSGTTAFDSLIRASKDAVLFAPIGRALASSLHTKFAEFRATRASSAPRTSVQESEDAVSRLLQACVAVVAEDGKSSSKLAAALEAGGLGREVALIHDYAYQARQAAHRITDGLSWPDTFLSATEILVSRLAELAPPVRPSLRSRIFSKPQDREAKASTPSSSQTIPSAVITVIGGQLFRDVRASFGIRDEDFLGSLGIRQVIGGLLMGDLRGLSEMVSEGKSGSLFFWSHDGRFLVKTISEDERGSLISMLRS
jgi:Ca2+-binding EF-hand superfamily protein